MTEEIASSGKTLYEGETFQLTASVLPNNATDKTVTWRSSNTAYATVDENGLVTAISGTPSGNNVTITVENSNGNTASMNFHIKQHGVQQVILNRDSVTLRVGDTLRLEATVLPENIQDKSISWSSKNFTIATVSDGLVTAKMAGVVNIIARANFADGDVSDTCVVTVIPQPTKYLIRFRDWDNTILQSSQVEEGQMPVYTGETPTRPEDDQYTYTFSGWSPEIVPATENANYIAQYTATEKTIIPDTTYYTVTFLDWDGTELLVEQVAEGHDAVGPATTPTREGYNFTGWSKAITNITANLIVVAQYELILQPVYYTIRFLNYDGTELQSSQVLEGDMPVYNGTTPTKPEDDDYTYEFIEWSPTIVEATADADYTAQFKSTQKSQSLDEVQSDQVPCTKVLIDGEIYILRGEKVYTLQGQEVK